MDTYHLPIQLSGSLDTRKEIEHLRAILNDPDTTVDTVIEVRTSHPAIIAVIEHLVGKHETAVMEVVPDASPVEDDRLTKMAAAISKLPASHVAPVIEIPARKPALENRPCDVCGQMFPPKRSDSRFCSNACKGKAYKVKSNGNGHKPEPPAEQASEAQADDEPHHQVRAWKLADGKEVDNVSLLLAKGKVHPGDRLHHHKRGWYEVTTGKRGLTLHRVQL